MKYTKSAVAALFAAGAILTAPIAGADATTQNIGQAGELTNGNVVQTWTVTGLKPSSDVIPHNVVGTLWEVTATNEAVAGSVTPIVSNFNARAADGTTYRALFQVPTAEGVNPSTLAQGQTTTGKIYFDVVGASPDSVVYNSGGTDLLVWLPAPVESAPAPVASTPPAPVASTPQAPAAAEAGTEATEAEDTEAEGTEAEGAEGTEAEPTGSQGTPIEEGQAAPAAEGTEGEATPATEGTEGQATPAGDPQTPAQPQAEPAGSQGTPITEGSAEEVIEEVIIEPAGVPHGPQPAS